MRLKGLASATDIRRTGDCGRRSGWLLRLHRRCADAGQPGAVGRGALIGVGVFSAEGSEVGTVSAVTRWQRRPHQRDQTDHGSRLGLGERTVAVRQDSFIALEGAVVSTCPPKRSMPCRPNRVCAEPRRDLRPDRLPLPLALDRVPDQRGDVGAAERLHLADAGRRGDVDLGQIGADHVDAR